MKKILLIVSLFCIANLSAQDATQFTFAPGSDTLIYKWERTRPDNFGFEPVAISRADYTFRLTWCYNSIILYKNDGKYYGWAKTYITDNEDTNNTFGMTFSVDSLTAKNLIALIDSTQISKIPTDNLIKGWPDGFDGVGYTIEEKYNGKYSYKTYWSPENQKLPEAQIIANFTKDFKTISNFNKLTYVVYDQRPFQYFGVGCGVVGLPIFTKKETKLFEQRRQNYLKMLEREAALMPENE